MKIDYSCVAQLAEHPTVNRTVTGSSPVAGAIESLGSPRLFYFHRIGGQTRHPIINREIHGEDLTTTHIRQTGHCQFTDERHGIPSISLGIPRKSYIETLVRGMAESIGKSGALGATPASTRFTPSMATMAPLSVQSLICGIRTSTPYFSPNSSSLARSCELAEKPPPTISVLESYCRQPRMALRASTVATESAREAHTSSTGISWPAACSLSTQRATAVLTPEKLKS